jgi:hypothetical protein
MFGTMRIGSVVCMSVVFSATLAGPALATTIYLEAENGRGGP